MIQIILSINAVLAALIYPFLALLRGGRSISAVSLLLALWCLAAVELFDLLVLLESGGDLYWRRYSLAAEGFLVPLTLFFSLAYARRFVPSAIAWHQWTLLAASLAFPLAALLSDQDLFYFSPDFVVEGLLFLTPAAFYFYLGMLVFLVIALINLEFTLRSAERSVRWRIKFDIIGAGTILAVLILFYSQGLLFRTLNMQLVPARSAMVILGVLLMIYSGTRAGESAGITVSRRMALNSVVLLGVGVYLISIGLLGEGMKYFGITFRDSLLVVAGFFFGLGLLVLLLSETVRRKAWVYLHKNFYREKYDYRGQWQDFTKRLALARSAGDLHKAVLTSFVDAFGMGGGALYLKDPNGPTFGPALCVSMEPGDTAFSKNDELVRYMSLRKWVVDVDRECPALKLEQQKFFRERLIRLVIPLYRNGGLEGFILLGNSLNVSETYNYEDYDMMKALARQAASALTNLRLAEELAEAREMEAAGKVSAFILHDLKNLVYALSLILNNARDHIDNPEFQQDMLESLTSTVNRMNMLIAQLKNLPRKSALEKQDTDLFQLARTALEQVANGRIELNGDQTLIQGDAQELLKVMVNLLVNALEADQADGPVLMGVGMENGEAFFRVKDDGCGISPEFLRDHLFTPFMTTKKKGLGIGLYQSKRIVEGHGGRIEVRSREGHGAEFLVWLPQ